MSPRSILALILLGSGLGWGPGLPPGSALADDFPTPRDTEPSPGQAMPPAEAAAGFRSPEGFRVTVFAAEPDVRNPVALAWDPRGRLWVAENYTYAETALRFDLRQRDRVLIFEDVDHDGRFDQRKVFTDDVQRLGSVAVGLGGVWLMCPPQLLFLPDRDGDDRPDGPAEVVLDGFKTATENHHTFANGLKWGPDGWLYGRCGASSPAEVGVPGTPDAARIPVRGGVWRYHPRTRHFETLAHGTTNPWGHDWDALGEAFFINTVNGHLWHLIPGSHLVRPHTIEPNSRAYALIDQHADHWHWDNSRPLKNGPTDHPEDNRRGGGHAHIGAILYQADQWPAMFRGKLLTLNLHGRRLNVERLEREGSGFVGRHEPDILFAADPWFRGIDLTYGPDGGVFLLDWSDTGECHEHEGVHRNSGRIFKVTHGVPAVPAIGDVGALSEMELVALHRHSNEWYTRQARRVLADRAERGVALAEARAALRAMAETEADPVRRLRALWTLYDLGGTDARFLLAQLDHPHESVRAWALRLLTDHLPIDTIYSKRGGPDVSPSAELRDVLVRRAKIDPSALVRLVLASTLQRLPVRERLPLATALASHSEDANDHNLPSLIWTGLIPVAEVDPDGMVALAKSSRIPVLVRLITRRLGEEIDGKPAPITTLLEAARGDVGLRGEVLGGLLDALTGRRTAPRPAGWDALVAGLTEADRDVRDNARRLSVLFGDGVALDEVRTLALDDHADLDARKAAVRTLIESRPPDLREICERLLRVRYLNSVAVRGLTLFDDPRIGRALASNYRSFHPSERAAVLEALVSRPTFAHALLDQIGAGKILRSDLSAYHARQILSFGDAPLSRHLAEVWGALRDTSSDRRGQIERFKAQLDPATLARADRGHGRMVFDRVCGQCHKLYGRGGEIGPDLTGSGRENLDYLLENIVDPSASVSADFRVSVVAMKDGRVLNGLARTRTDHTLTLQTPNEALVLDRDEIDEIRPSTQSLMPEGQADMMPPDDLRDLIGYLMTRSQVPLPAEPAAGK